MLKRLRIRSINNPKDKQTIHVSRVKPAYTRDEEDDDEKTSSNDYEIDFISNKRVTPEGVEYKVQWKGYTKRYD